MAEPKEKLLGMTLDTLKNVTSMMSLPAYAAGQIADWLYRKRITAIDDMTNLAAAKREQLSLHYEIGGLPPSETVESADGTVKYLFPVNNRRHSVESVYIPSKERATLCVSSQVGCKMNCLFCMTGKQGFSANLTANEMMNQIQSIPNNRELTNIVFMGMGEPLDNIDELCKTLEILTSDYGYGWSPKRITVSTIGILPGLKRLLDESNCHLAVSLNSPFHDERLALMPAEKAYPAEIIIDALHGYDFSHQRRISFEYILFEGFNDSDKHAKALARLLKGLECRINLIRFHAIPGVSLRSCPDWKMEKFRESLNALGITATIRASRGEDVFAACGMLSTAKKNKR
jgi:23S rRNA (adenine2503-C2)-methyltransferase